MRRRRPTHTGRRRPLTKRPGSRAHVVRRRPTQARERDYLYQVRGRVTGAYFSCPACGMVLHFQSNLIPGYSAKCPRSSCRETYILGIVVHKPRRTGPRTVPPDLTLPRDVEVGDMIVLTPAEVAAELTAEEQARELDPLPVAEFDRDWEPGTELHRFDPGLPDRNFAVTTRIESAATLASSTIRASRNSPDGDHRSGGSDDAAEFCAEE